MLFYQILNHRELVSGVSEMSEVGEVSGESVSDRHELSAGQAVIPIHQITYMALVRVLSYFQFKFTISVSVPKFHTFTSKKILKHRYNVLPKPVMSFKG